MEVTMSISANPAPAVPHQSLDDLRWEHILHRSTTEEIGIFPGAFFYGVTTTGIFCRPQCPSRRPARANAHFFDSTADARRAGFRPCMRCNPEGQEAAQEQAELVQRLCAYLDRTLDESITIDDVAVVAGLSPSHTQRIFQRITGLTIRQYRKNRKMAHFSSSLAKRPTVSITDALYDAGFSSSSRLYETSTQSLGMRPKDLRNHGNGQSIDFTCADSPLGRMLVAATANGVCAIEFGDDDAFLEAALRQRFSKAEIHRQQNPVLTEAVQAVLQRITESGESRALPLAIRATAFQQRVWNALTQTPRGETRTYTQVAQSIGSPTAARAVARACASNPVAIAIPCHRVIGSNGALSGYRWGIERKRQLLQLERSDTATRLGKSVISTEA